MKQDVEINSISKEELPNFQYKIKNKVTQSVDYNEVPGWPIGSNQFGQISGVDVDRDGNIVIFHRGNHVWDTT